MIRLSHDQLKTMLDQHEDLALIDIVPLEHFHKEHIPHSINVPLEENEFEREVAKRTKSKAKKIVLYSSDPKCRTTYLAANKLEEAGYQNVFVYEGGVKDWCDHGETIEGRAEDITVH